MKDSDGILPSSGKVPRPDFDADATLPSSARPVPGPAAIPSSATGVPNVTVPSLSEPQAAGAVEASSGPAPTFQRRLAETTAAGGLSKLPPDFGDADGAWQTILIADDPFAMLYLDCEQAEHVTPEIVARHRDLLKSFWQDKLRKMSQGAARLSILKKYGGDDENERRVRGYPDEIDRAFAQLATRDAIADRYKQLRAAKESAILALIDGKMNDFLVDMELQPSEVHALFELGERTGLPRQMVADRVNAGLRARGFVARTPPVGATPAEQLMSTTWGQPIADLVAGISPPPRVEGSPYVPVLLFSVVVAAILVVGAVVIVGKWPAPLPQPQESRRNAGATSDQRPAKAGTPLPPPGAEKPVPQPGTGLSEPVRPALHGESTPMDARPQADSHPPQPVLTTSVLVKEPPEPVVTPSDRQRVQQELEGIRMAAVDDPDTALNRAALLREALSAHPQEYADERVTLATLNSDIQLAAGRKRQQEQVLADRQLEWARRIAQIEGLINERNYSGAKKLSDDLLAEPNVPAPVAERAKRLGDDAITALQKIFSDAKVKTKTTRSPHGANP